MSKYDFSINPAIIELLPPDKRKPKTLKLLGALTSPLQWAHDLLFNSYYKGIVAPIYTVKTYAYLEQATYQKRVYLSLIGSNTNPPLPMTSPATWELIQDNFIGVQERLLYSGSKLVLEYALNKQFNTVFRQPAAVSDIYITNDLPVIAGFLVGITEPFCSSVGQTTSSDAIGGNLPAVYLNNFIIHVPTIALNLTVSGNTESVKNFVNKYIPASINYTVINY